MCLLVDAQDQGVHLGRRHLLDILTGKIELQVFRTKLGLAESLELFDAGLIANQFPESEGPLFDSQL